jgi:hypothetical protein
MKKAGATALVCTNPDCVTNHPPAAAPVESEGAAGIVESDLREAADFVQHCRGTEPAEFYDRHAARLRLAADFVSRPSPPEDYADWKIRPDEDGVDEIVGTGFLHMERMSDDVWWFGLYAARDGNRERLTWTVSPEGCRVIEYPMDAPEPFRSTAKKLADAPDPAPTEPSDG